LNQDKFNLLKKDLKKIGIVLLVSIIILKILFYKENLWVILKLVLSFLWLIILPGFSLMYYWGEKLNFIERLLIGIVLGTVLFAGISYYLGLLAIHIKYHIIGIPIILLILAWFINKNYFKK